MALGGLEWIIIGVIVVVMVLWGPKKIPEFARAIGLARKQFEQAKNEVENPTTALLDRATQGSQGPTVSTSDDALLQTAKRLGINTEGKTSQQLSEEIVARAKNPYGR